ncbi:MAG: protein kinase [Planctomycetota bacterium]
MTSTDCPSDDRLAAFAAGSLPPGQADPLITHVDGCQRCQARFERLDSGHLVPSEVEDEFARLRFHESQDNTETIAKLLSARSAKQRRDDISKADTPTRIGAYSIVREIAVGGMGTVYEAKHVNLGRRFALKLLGDARIRSRKQADQVLREWRAHGRLNHPHVVAATDAGLIDGRPYLVMELVHGLTLSELVKNTGPLHLADACAIIRQVAIALQYTHQEGVAHLDIKPSNIMLDQDGQAKLLDLGTARIIDLQPDSDSTSSLGLAGEEFGTLGFLAPERTRPDFCFDSFGTNMRFAADVYSLGCTLQYLLTGKAPFGNITNPTVGNPTTAELIRAHREQPPPQVQFCADDPATHSDRQQIQSLIDRMLSKAPADRPSDMGQIANELSSVNPTVDTQRLLQAASDPTESPFDSRTGETVRLTELVRSASGRTTRRLRAWHAMLLVCAALGGTAFLSPSWRRESGRQNTPPNNDSVKRLPGFEASDQTGWTVTPRAQSGYLFRSQSLFEKVRQDDDTIMSVALKTVAPRKRPTQIAWSHDGSRLAVLSRTNQLRIYRWDGKSLSLETLFREHRTDLWIHCFCWHPVDNRLIVATKEKFAIATISADGRYVFESQNLKVNAIESVHALKSGDQTLIVVSTPQRLIGWDPTTQSEVSDIANVESSLVEATGADGTYAVCTPTSVDLWNAVHEDDRWRFETVASLPIGSGHQIQTIDDVVRLRLDGKNKRLGVFLRDRIVIHDIPTMKLRSVVGTVASSLDDPELEFLSPSAEGNDRIITTSKTRIRRLTPYLQDGKWIFHRRNSNACGGLFSGAKVAAHPTTNRIAVAAIGRLEIWNHEIETLYRVPPIDRVVQADPLQRSEGTFYFRADGGGVGVDHAGKFLGPVLSPTNAEQHRYLPIVHQSIVEPEQRVYQATAYSEWPVEVRSLADHGVPTPPSEVSESAPATFAIIPQDAIPKGELAKPMIDAPDWHLGAIHPNGSSTQPSEPRFLTIGTDRPRQVTMSDRGDSLLWIDDDSNYTWLGNNRAGERVTRRGALRYPQSHMGVALSTDSQTAFIRGYTPGRGLVTAVDFASGKVKWRKTESAWNSEGDLAVLNDGNLVHATWYGWFILDSSTGETIRDVTPRYRYGFRHNHIQRGSMDGAQTSWEPYEIEPAAHWSPKLSLRYLVFSTGPNSWIVFSAHGKVLAQTDPQNATTNRYIYNTRNHAEPAAWAEFHAPTAPIRPTDSFCLVCYHNDGRITVRPWE